MLHEDLDPKEVSVLLREFFSSVREINRRIDELCSMIKQGNDEEWLEEVGLQAMSDRVRALEETRLKIMDSIYDMRGVFIRNLSSQRLKNILEDREELYKQLREL